MIFALVEMRINFIYPLGDKFMIWIFVLLAAVGFSHIIVDGSILAKPRGLIVAYGPAWLKDLIACYMCSGFWTGLLLGLLSGVFINEWGATWFARLFVLPVVYGSATSYLSMFGAALLNYLDKPWSSDK
jgi:hypothetical protein